MFDAFRDPKSSPYAMPDQPRSPPPRRQATKRQVVYRPETFAVRSIEEAKRIILTAEAGTNTEERWAKETPYLAKELVRSLAPTETSVLLDYGCGIGRLAKELIAHTGCTVLGIDIRLEMRVLANSYVDSERFLATSPEGLAAMAHHGLRVDHAYTVWVLQHCLRPAEDIALLHACLRPGGRCYVTNGHTRCVPTDKGWVNDGADVAKLLASRFEMLEDRPFPEGVTTDGLRHHAFCRLYAARSAAPGDG